jgi:ribosomal protein S3AE
MAQAKKRKKFFDVSIPLIRKETQLIGFAVEELDGRYIKYDLTRTLRGKSTMLQSKVKVEGEKAIAYPTKIQLMPYYLRRMVRKGTNYVEDSFSTECKDAILRFKPFLVTRRKVSRAVRKALREKAKEEIIQYAKSRTTQEIFEDVLRNSLQKPLSLALKKVYPLSLCEIRVLRVEKELEMAKEEKPKKSTSKEEKAEEVKEETTAETDKE